MFMTPCAFPSELADIGLAAAADPLYAERLIEALSRLTDQTPAIPSGRIEHAAMVRVSVTA